MAMTGTPLWGMLQRAIDVWALLGGLVLVILVLINVWAVAGEFFGIGFAGDVELTEMGVAAAAFAFLPYCQLHRQNVRADLFTAATGPRVRRVLDSFASAVALGFAAILLWRMFFGLIDQRTFGYSSTILQVPTWWVFIPVLISLFLLVVAALMTLLADVAGDA